MRTAASGGPQARNVQHLQQQGRAPSPLRLAGLPAANKCPARPHSARVHRPSSATAELPPAVRSQSVSPWLPPTAPKHLSECTESCYWRWLVHMLLEDVAALKDKIDVAQEEYLGHVRERQKLEQRHRDFEHLKHVHANMTKELANLRQEAPELAAEIESLNRLKEDLQGNLEAQELRKENLSMSVKRLYDKRAKTEETLTLTTREVAQCKKRVADLETKLETTADDFDRLQIERKDSEAEVLLLRAFKEEIEKNGKKKKKGKSPKRK